MGTKIQQTEDPIKTLFQNDEYSKAELLRCRKVMGNKNTTEDQWYSMNQTVGFMFLYCSEELQPVVLAILNEITMREFYMHKIWREQKEKART